LSDEYPTINAALQNATDGDTILIRVGTYNETITITKAITLKGEDTNRTIINGNMSGTAIQILHDNVTGLTVNYGSVNTPMTYWIEGFPADWAPKWGDYDANQYPKEGGHFIRYGEWRIAGIHLQNSKHCNIYGNKILDCGEGIWLWKSSQNNIYGNVLERNDYGLAVDESYNNTVTGNTFADGGGGVWFSQGWFYNPT
jgi:nitrous oxidase accessory protein